MTPAVGETRSGLAPDLATPELATLDLTTLDLVALGRRICVVGPSNSGKSTLAAALGRRLDLPVVHLDRLRFLPGTDWQLQTDAAFVAAHDAAVAGDAWIVDGNYSLTLPTRLAQASAIIALESGRVPALLRYLRRTLFEKRRAGHLEGGRDSLKWSMVHWILIEQPRRSARFSAMLRASGVPMLTVPTMPALRRLYRRWGLDREAF